MLIFLLAVLATVEMLTGAWTGNVVLFGASLGVLFLITVGLFLHAVAKGGR